MAADEAFTPPPSARVWLVVPGTDVLWRDVEIPARAGNRARAAAAFVLEDELAVDTDQIHFAVAAKATSAAREVLAVAHAKVSSWRQWMRERGLTADVVVPDFLAIPPGQIIADAPLAIVRGPGASFTVETDLLSAVLSDAFPGEAPAAQFMDEPRLLSLLYAGLRTGDFVTLLQGSYAPPRRFALDKAWRRAAILAGVTIGLAGLTQIVDGVRLNREADAALLRAETVMRDAMPGVKRVVNPRAQIRARLAELRGGSSTAFLKLCQVLFVSVEKSDGVEIQNLRYDARRNEISVTLTLPSYESMERVKADLRTLGATIQEGGARQDGTRILADITVRAS